MEPEKLKEMCLFKKEKEGEGTKKKKRKRGDGRQVDK